VFTLEPKHSLGFFMTISPCSIQGFICKTAHEIATSTKSFVNVSHKGISLDELSQQLTAHLDPSALLHERLTSLIRANKLDRNAIAQEILRKYKTVARENSDLLRECGTAGQVLARLNLIEKGRRYLSFADGMIICSALKIDPWRLMGEHFYNERPVIGTLDHYYLSEHKILYSYDAHVYLYRFENAASSQEILIYTSLELRFSTGGTASFDLESTLKVNEIKIKHKSDVLLLAQPIKNTNANSLEMFHKSLGKKANLKIDPSYSKFVGLFDDLPNCLLISSSEERMKKFVAPIAIHEHLTHLYKRYGYVYQVRDKTAIMPISNIELEAHRQLIAQPRKRREKPANILPEPGGWL
jgi:hypothetical protein